jgi:hypothetical protein
VRVTDKEGGDILWAQRFEYDLAIPESLNEKSPDGRKVVVHCVLAQTALFNKVLRKTTLYPLEWRILNRRDGVGDDIFFS